LSSASAARNSFRENFKEKLIMKTRILISVAALALALGLISCAGDRLFPSGGSVSLPTIPKFLIAVDRSGSTADINVFPVNATTGVLGAAVVGSPFDLGLTHGMTLAVHPNGHFVYAADGSDGSIHMWNVSETTGVPVEIATKVINESGSFFAPFSSSDSPTHAITVTPAGKYLYSANNDATVGAYRIGADGSLTHISDLNVGACSTGAITATDGFAWVTDSCDPDVGPWNIMSLKIGSDGSLTKVSSVALANVFAWLWSIQVNPVANFLYTGDEGGAAQVYSFAIAADGSLTLLGPQVVEKTSSDCQDIAHSPDGKFFYSSDDDQLVHVFSVDTTSGAIAELASSPYLGGSGQIVSDVTGKFVYVADEDGTGQVIGYTRDMTTGALTLIGNTDTANNQVQAIGIVR
jgi:6-phosphogluconolactonase (cycloisomerase 2 family)